MSFTGTESDFDEKMPVDVGTGKVSVLVQGDGGATSNRCNRSTVRWRHKLARRWRWGRCIQRGPTYVRLSRRRTLKGIQAAF